MHFCEEPPFLGPPKLLMSKELVSICFLHSGTCKCDTEEIEIDMKIVLRWEDNYDRMEVLLFIWNKVVSLFRS